MSQDLELIGARIKRSRQKQKLSQADLAELLKVSSAHVSDIERGKTNCSVTIIKRIAEVLRVSADWLLLLDTEAAHSQASVELQELLVNFSPIECEFLLANLLHIKKTLHILEENEDQ